MGINFEEFQKHAAARRDAVMKSSGGGGGGGRQPGWAMRMRYFTLGEIPTKIRLIPYRKGQLWFDYMSRWIKVTVGQEQVSRQVISNSHNGEIPGVPCLLYYYMIEEANTNLQASKSAVVTVSVLENFHKVKGGTSKKGKDWFTHVRCEGVNRYGQPVCQPCRDNNPIIFGNQYHWSFWQNAQQQFEEELNLIPNRCCSCFNGEIMVFGYTCSKCDVELANHYNGGIAPEVEQALRTEPTTCPSCKETAMAAHLIECVIRHGEGVTAKYTEGCKTPKRPSADIQPWEYDLTVVENKVGNASSIRIIKFTPPEKLADDLLKPMEFVGVWSHMSLDEQAKALNRANPWGAAEQKLLDDHFAQPAAPIAPPNQADGNSVPWGNRTAG